MLESVDMTGNSCITCWHDNYMRQHLELLLHISQRTVLDSLTFALGGYTAPSLLAPLTLSILKSAEQQQKQTFLAKNLKVTHTGWVRDRQ